MELLLSLLRASLGRCPHCGGRFSRGIRMLDRCERCQLHIHRGRADSGLGALTVNILLGDGLVLLLLVLVVEGTSPHTPWDAIGYGCGLGVILMPLLLHPISRTLWLAIDIGVHPLRSDEVQGP
jgi:uncharacterized protein (DUF983 family)